MHAPKNRTKMAHGGRKDGRNADKNATKTNEPAKDVTHARLLLQAETDAAKPAPKAPVNNK